MKIFNPDDLYDHTIKYLPQEKEELLNYLDSNNIIYYNWNNGTLVIKKECGVFLPANSINGLGYFEAFWHNDVKKIINCKPTNELETLLERHTKAVNKLTSELEELNALKSFTLS